MPKPLFPIRGLTLLLCSGLAATSASAEPTSTSIKIQGTVPTVCRAQFSAGDAVVSQQILDLGVLSEVCNNIGGYRVILSHPSDMAGAKLVIDGRDVSLSASGVTVITDASQPGVSDKRVLIDFGASEVAPRSLGLRIEPKGPVY